MSAIVAWFGGDESGPSASYLAVADEVKPLAYASPYGPDLVGCCSVGVGWTPFMAVCEDAEASWRAYGVPRVRSTLLLRKLRAAPPPTCVTHVVHCGRAGENKGSRFVLWSATWKPPTGWEVNAQGPLDRGLPVMVCGTDARALLHAIEKTPDDRGVLSTFCDFAAQRAHPYVTQLVATYRYGPAETLGQRW